MSIVKEVWHIHERIRSPRVEMIYRGMVTSKAELDELLDRNPNYEACHFALIDDQSAVTGGRIGDNSGQVKPPR